MSEPSPPSSERSRCSQPKPPLPSSTRNRRTNRTTPDSPSGQTVSATAGSSNRFFTAGTIPAASSAVDPEILFRSATCRSWIGLRRPGNSFGLERSRASHAALGAHTRGFCRARKLASGHGVHSAVDRDSCSRSWAAGAVRRNQADAQHHLGRGPTLRRHQTCQPRRLQPPHQSAVERPTGNPGQLLQLDDHVDREAGSGAKRKAASGRRIGDCAGSAGAALSQVDYATGKPRSTRVLPSGADGERRLLRFSGA